MRRRRSTVVRTTRRAAPKVLAVLGVVAMLTPVLTPFATSDLAAYRPDHGHLHAAGDAVPPHDHPWDDHRAPRPDAPTLFDALAFHPVAADIAPSATTAGTSHAEIVFTHGDDGSPGSSSGLALPGAATAFAAHSSTFPAAASDPLAPRDHAPSVPTEPPRA